jgi:hypothetical protein
VFPEVIVLLAFLVMRFLFIVLVLTPQLQHVLFHHHSPPHAAEWRKLKLDCMESMGIPVVWEDYGEEFRFVEGP